MCTELCVTTKKDPAHLLCALPFRKDPQLQMDFHTGRDPTSDIAFHFRVYFGRYVVMNSLQDGGWRTEVTSHRMPFEDNKQFKLRNKFQVSAPGAASTQPPWAFRG